MNPELNTTPQSSSAIFIPVTFTFEELTQIAAEKLSSVLVGGTQIEVKKISATGCAGAVAMAVRPTDELTLHIQVFPVV